MVRWLPNFALSSSFARSLNRRHPPENLRVIHRECEKESKFFSAFVLVALGPISGQVLFVTDTRKVCSEHFCVDLSYSIERFGSNFPARDHTDQHRHRPSLSCDFRGQLKYRDRRAKHGKNNTRMSWWLAHDLFCGVEIVKVTRADFSEIRKVDGEETPRRGCEERNLWAHVPPSLTVLEIVNELILFR